MSCNNAYPSPSFTFVPLIQNPKSTFLVHNCFSFSCPAESKTKLFFNILPSLLVLIHQLSHFPLTRPHASQSPSSKLHPPPPPTALPLKVSKVPQTFTLHSLSVVSSGPLPPSHPFLQLSRLIKASSCTAPLSPARPIPAKASSRRFYLASLL